MIYPPMDPDDTRGVYTVTLYHTTPVDYFLLDPEDAALFHDAELVLIDPPVVP